MPGQSAYSTRSSSRRFQWLSITSLAPASSPRSRWSLLFLAISLAMITGCRHERVKVDQHPQVELPLNCLYPIQIPASHCTQIAGTPLFMCDHMIVRPECISPVKQK